MIKYDNYSIMFQEVPDEISLVFTITNCQNNCEGCHSPWLREDAGRPLRHDIDGLIKKYANQITCVCLMGDGNDYDELEEIFSHIKDKYELKTCLYTGCNHLNKFGRLFDCLDYIKIGSYDKNKGGLCSRTTNQVFYKITNGKFEDITHRFWDRKD